MFKKIFLLAVFACITLSNQQLTRLTNKYFASDVPLEFVQAYAVCKRNGIIFATEQNKDETDFINAILVAAKKTDKAHWLGGINETKGELHPAWVWMDINREISDYTRWAPTEPSAVNGNCMLRNINGSWLAQPCSGINHFLCQEP